MSFGELVGVEVAAQAAGLAGAGDLEEGGISQKMLTQTLRDLQRAGLVDRTAYAEVPARVEYTLTKTGRELAPLLSAICGWAEKHAIDSLD